MDNLLAVLFLARDAAHREHLSTGSYAAHIALGDFYEGVVELADKLAEAYQGRTGKKLVIPYMDPPSGAIIKQLEAMQALVESERYKAVPKEDTPLQNILDEIVGLFLSTLYKLKRFA